MWCNSACAVFPPALQQHFIQRRHSVAVIHVISKNKSINKMRERRIAFVWRSSFQCFGFILATRYILPLNYFDTCKLEPTRSVDSSQLLKLLFQLYAFLAVLAVFQFLL